MVVDTPETLVLYGLFCTSLLERMAFTSIANRLHFRVIREVRRKRERNNGPEEPGILETLDDSECGNLVTRTADCSYP